MCGIAGILKAPGAEPVSLDALNGMIAMLRHRGPDEYGYYRDERVGLGHARLSIIDLTSGAQPIANEDGTIWITFNGEIFNYVELRHELEQAGHRFATRTDTEVIIHAYEEYGPAAWQRFNGQFAFALWEQRARKLWLVRDPLGILPLFYALTDRALVFGSEAKALFASGLLAPRFDSLALRQVFTRWSAVAPATIFAGVRCVPPGTALCWDEQLRVRESRYWQLDLAPAADLDDLGLDEAADELGARLRRCVQLRLRADVPVGAYLSGGLDSSMIAGLLQAQEGQVFHIQRFCGFPDLG
jgi:asparagine synthase (glutamine-hydrolysing)